MYINSEHKKGSELMDEFKFEEAIVAFNKALETNPKHPDILSLRGVTYLHLNQKKNCLTDLELALSLEDDNAYRYTSLAYAKDFFGDLDSAIELYEQAVKIDPEDAIAYNNLGLLLEKKGYATQAKKNFDDADKLILHQDGVKEKIEDLSNQENTLPKPNKNKINTNAPTGEQVQPKKLKTEKVPTASQISKDLFTKKSTFKEFIGFIRNGFRLKEDK
ncbi:MAG: tetratricopeptide repeat protein [Brumimicrobium sp.]|nr:tetratricopeptide repeat protein [Brumimicrobium sp.]MCO5268303.1 tetratricopeptide repeat protein [Brumimicrobium sp.]